MALSLTTARRSWRGLVLLSLVLQFVVSISGAESLNLNFKPLPDDDSFEGFEPVPFEVLMRKYRAELKGWAEPKYTDSEKQLILSKYNHLDPQREIATSLLENAVLYYHWNLDRISNKKYLTVIDFGLHSAQKRFFIIETESGSVWSTRVAHGEGSDRDDDGYAERFVNIVNSNATSLGAYLTAETYNSDKNGLSMRLDGLSDTNSKARERAVVFHGAEYVADTNVKPGRSWGCPAIPMGQRTMVVNWIKGGSVMYAGKSR